MAQVSVFSGSKKAHSLHITGPKRATVAPEPPSPPPLANPSNATSGTPPSVRRIGPKLAPGNLTSMRKFFFDSSKTLMQRVPTMRTILKDMSKNKPPVNARRASGVSARSRVIRDYESNHLKDESEVAYGWVILPRAPWKVRWDLWIGLIIFYSVVLIPYRIGFGIDIEVRESRHSSVPQVTKI